jgi:hypothetical protein
MDFSNAQLFGIKAKAHRHGSILIQGPAAANSFWHSSCLSAITLPDHRWGGPDAWFGGVHVGVASKIRPNARCLAGFAERDGRLAFGLTVSAIAGLAQMRQQK